MARKIEVFNGEGIFSHYAKRCDGVLAVREGRADWNPANERQLLMRPKILQVRGKLGIWCAVACPDVPNVGGTGPRFRTLQLV